MHINNTNQNYIESSSVFQLCRFLSVLNFSVFRISIQLVNLMICDFSLVALYIYNFAAVSVNILGSWH